jgi:hypothetical protein
LPKIVTTDITTEINYREIRLIFSAPRGLRKFLFYEQDVSRFPNFNRFDRFYSPEPVFTFTALEPGVTYYFRIRVVSTEGEVGPWSDNVVVTALGARASSVFNNRTLGGIVNSNAVGNSWKTVLEVNHTAIGGILFYMINFELRHLNNFSPQFNVSWNDIEFRWTENDVPVGGNFHATTYGIYQISTVTPTEDGVTILQKGISGTISKGAFDMPGNFTGIRSGTFCQRLHEVVSGTITIKLQARLINPHPSSHSWLSSLDPALNRVRYTQGARLRMRNFSSFEYICDS